MGFLFEEKEEDFSLKRKKIEMENMRKSPDMRGVSVIC